MIDCNFPHIIYEKGKSYFDWGLLHGNTFKKEICELAEIRKDLMLAKSPHLKSSWQDLAKEQARITKENFPNLFEELRGIAQGTEIDLDLIIVLNNYTDFRDIKTPENQDEGCTSIGLKRKDSISAQTWDMHSTAKNYVCVIELPGDWLSFSLVGCLGMMGANKNNLFVGVNNINTNDARPGVVWPAFVRSCLELSKFEDAVSLAKNTPFTSGHNYLISDGHQFEHWEISPTKQACSSRISKDTDGFIYHTNHCLTTDLQSIEEKVATSSTTHDRFIQLEKKDVQITTDKDVHDLLTSHDGFPKSICGHYESGAQDPSMTCGGGLFNHSDKTFHFWRGCKEYDNNYREHFLRL